MPLTDPSLPSFVRDVGPTYGGREAATERLLLAERDVDRLELVVGRGGDARRRSLVVGRPLTVGSHASCDVVLADRAVSARHCTLLRDESDTVWLEDLGSSNGTFVDGVRVARAALAVRARLRVGRTDLFLVGLERRRREELVAASPVMLALVDEVVRFASLTEPTLVRGPSGAGKEGIARLLHTRSARAAGPWVAVNAGALPRDLLESELFGHERGAFTGAQHTRRGVFEQADGGTLFLDEIGELDLDMQVRLLRVLETWEVRRVGGEEARKVDVRLVSATHRDLHDAVRRGTFRLDLYYRLAQLAVVVPPLSQRPEDIVALTDRFLGDLAGTEAPRVLTTRARDRLLVHPYPGNVRELRSILRRATASTAGIVDVVDIERAIESLGGAVPTTMLTSDSLDRLVREHGSVAAVARHLGVPRSTLRGRLARRLETER